MKFGNYWFETGTPSYLAQLLKQNKCNLARLSGEVVTSDLLNGVDTLKIVLSRYYIKVVTLPLKAIIPVLMCTHWDSPTRK